MIEDAVEAGFRPVAGGLPSVAGGLAAVRADPRVWDTLALLLRIGVGWIFMFHGAGKLFDFHHMGGISGTTAFFAFQGIPAAHLFAYVAGIAEFFGGLMLFVGLLSPIAGLALVIDMIVAWIINFKIGLPTPTNPKLAGADGYQVNIALASVALTIAVMGPGRISLDRLLGLAGKRRPAR